MLYFGAYLGNPYAENLIQPLAWVLIVCGLILSFAMVNDEQKEKFKLKRKPKSSMFKYYSYTYDALVFLALCAFGYTVTAAFWAISLVLAHATLDKIDKEILEKKSD